MKDGRSIILLLTISALFAYLLRGFLGNVSSYFFVPIDNLLFISDSIPPVLMWMAFGLLVGLAYGSFIAIKKYRLDYKLLIMPVLALLVGLTLILIASFVVSKFKEKPDVDVTVEDVIHDGDRKYLSSANLIKLNEILRKGILAVENERYESAEALFIKAASIGRGDSRLDSLAGIYTNTGNEKCRLFRRDSELKYIPDYYYKYAAALTSKPPKICK